MKYTRELIDGITWLTGQPGEMHAGYMRARDETVAVVGVPGVCVPRRADITGVNIVENEAIDDVFHALVFARIGWESLREIMRKEKSGEIEG